MSAREHVMTCEAWRSEQWAQMDPASRLDHLRERAAEMAAHPWAAGTVLAVMEAAGVPAEDREKARQIAAEWGASFEGDRS